MKKLFGKVVAVTVACMVMLAGCGSNSQKEAAVDSSIITKYDWQASNDGSLITCETNGTFKYYRSAEELTDDYFEGTYEFAMGKDAVKYITTELEAYKITEEELERVFDGNESYDESNFVCLVLNNEKCIMDGENQIETPYQTPYFGFYLEQEDQIYLDIANMNTGNYVLYIAK